MRRLDESDNSRFEESVKLGEDNAECLRYMSFWCKHVEIKPEASGLYAQMTGLPIGSYSIACPYVQGGWSAMNLRWIFSDFLNQHCADCSHHSPNGNTTWGQKIIDDYQENKRKQEQAAEQETTRLSELLATLRSKSKDIGAKIDPESQKIVEFLKAIFTENVEERSQAAEHLKNSARLAADLFTHEAVALILELAVSKEFSQLILPVCAELASKRADLATPLTETALNNIEKGFHAELSALVLEQLKNADIYPLSETHIKNLLILQNHYRDIGGWEDGKPDYSHSTAVLIRCFDAMPSSVEKVICRELKNENEYLRVQLCGALQLIQPQKPELVLNLLNEFLHSLELYENSHSSTDAPSTHIIHILIAAFAHNPELVDTTISKAMIRVRPAIQNEIIEVYRQQFFGKNLEWEHRREQRKRAEISEKEHIAIQRLLKWAKDEQFEIDIRTQILDALKIACDYANAEMVEYFDSLLGYYALVSQQKEPPKAPPKILLLNQLRQDKQLENLNLYSRNQSWGIFKKRIKDCLEEICKTHPSRAFDSISDCLNHPLEELDNNLKACCVSLLGEVGKDYQLQPKVLPLLWRALMDFESNLVRAEAIDAVTDLFSYSEAIPPANLIEIIIIFLSDRYVIIHRAALRAVSRHPNWFNGQQQSIEVLKSLGWQLQAYKDDKYQLDDICEGILAIGKRAENFNIKIFAFSLIKSIFPTGERIVDANIAEKLMRFYQPDESVARMVAKEIALYLGRYDRDHHNWYGHSRRGSMFKWLHKLPAETYQAIADDILDSAKEMAKRDGWEVCHFASFFALHQAFDYEKLVLEEAINGLPKEPRYEKNRAALQQLAMVAAANVALQAGDTQTATTYFAQGAGEI